MTENVERKGGGLLLAALVAFGVGGLGALTTTPVQATPEFRCNNLGCVLDRCVDYDDYECIEENGACAGTGCI